jgi:gamma-glutamyltranspeptidase/glutathione hydrolase
MRRLRGLVAVLALAFAAAVALPVLAGAADAPAAIAEQKPNAPVIASAHRLATEAGQRVLAEGGNAFDAAIAVSATLGLVEPESSGIGGGGFFLLRRASDGHVVFVDARERAPAAATRDMFLDADGQPIPERSINGPLAAAIPGLPAGLVHLAANYGRLPLERSLAPAIELAERGWPWGAKNQTMIGWRAKVLEGDRGARALFLPGGKPPAVGTTMRNPDYARTLRRLARDGFDGFYRGDTARRLVDGVRRAGGIWTLEDLAGYAVVEREPIRFAYRGAEIVTAPPPSSGGVALASILHILAPFDLAAMTPAARTHVLVEAMRRAYRDRAIYLGDPDQVRIPVDLLVDPAYAAGLRAGINLERATPSDLLPGISARPGSDQTTHFSIIDAEGNLAAVTQTVNLPFGNGMVVPGTGFVLNNEMDDFSVKPGVPNAFGLVGEDANAVAPGKRPLSSMTPTFVLAPDRVTVLGTPGGSRIISMVLLGVLGVLDGQGAQAVADAPRIHHQYLPDVLSAEPGALAPEVVEALKAKGHTVSQGERTWGNMQVASWWLSDGRVEAGFDRRWKSASVEESADGAIFR